MKISLQVLATSTSKKAIRSSLDALENVLRSFKEENQVDEIVVAIGEITKEASLDLTQLKELRRRYQDSFVMVYQHYGPDSTYGKVHNSLARSLRSDMIVLTRVEAIPQTDALSRIYSAINSNLRIGMVEAKKIPITPPASLNLISGEVNFCEGHFSILRHKDFERLGMLDETLPHPREADIDFSLRLQLDGMICIRDNSSVVFLDERIAPDLSTGATRAERHQLNRTKLILARKFGLSRFMKMELERSRSPSEKTEGRERKSLFPKRPSSRPVGPSARIKSAHRRFIRDFLKNL